MARDVRPARPRRGPDRGRDPRRPRPRGRRRAEDAPLLEVETDKAQVEIPSPFAGRVEKIHVQPGQTVKVGEPLVSFADAGGRGCAGTRPGAAAPLAPAPQRPGAHGPAAGAARRRRRRLPPRRRRGGSRASWAWIFSARARHAARAGASPTTTCAAPARASPRALRGAGRPRAPRPRARPSRSPPSALEPPPLPKFEQWGPVERQPLSHLRRTIAERMTLSAALIPHVTHFDKADITDLDAIVTRNFEAGQAARHHADADELSPEGGGAGAQRAPAVQREPRCRRRAS